MILTHLVLFEFIPGAGGAVTPPVVEETRPTGGGKGKRRRQIVFRDGRVVDARTEAEFQRLLWEMLAEADMPEFSRPTARKALKRGTRAMPYAMERDRVRVLRDTLLADLQAVADRALHEQTIIALASLAIQAMRDEEEEAAIMLLMH